MGMLEDEITEGLRMRLRDEKIAKLSAALRAMVDRWEPDCGGQDRVMWENAVQALEFANVDRFTHHEWGSRMGRRA